MQSEDVNASFSDNSETEREKTSNRNPTGPKDTNPKEIPSWRPLD